MRLVALLVLLLATGCAGTRWEAIDRSTLPTRADHPEAHRVELLDVQHLRFRVHAGRPVADLTHRSRFLVLDEHGGDGEVGVSWDRHFTEVTEFRARVLTPDGRSIEYGRDDAEDVAAFPRWMLYSDARRLRLQTGRHRAGTIIEVEHTLRYRDATLFLFGHRFGAGLEPSSGARFVVEAPAGWEIRSVAKELEEPIEWEPRVETGPGSARWIWEKEGQPGLELEAEGPPLGSRLPTVHVQLARWHDGQRPRETFADESALSRWMHEASGEAGRASEAIVSQTAALLADVGDDPAAKARVLYEWVRDQIAYCAIEMGMNGWIPLPADETFRARYGDCKGKAILLRSMLAVAGIESRLVLITSHQGWPRRFVLPALGGNFNHAILQIDLPSGPHLVDPTSRVAPFDALPAGDRGTDYLVVSATGESLRQTAPLTSSESVREIAGEFRLEADGRLEGRLLVLLFGREADDARGVWLYARDATQRRRGLERVARLHERMRLQREAVENATPSDAATPFTARATVAYLQAAGSSAGATRLLRASDLLAPVAPHLPGGRRTSPVLVRVGEESQRLVIHLPEAVVPTALPAPVVEESPWGRYELRWSAAEGGLLLEQRYVAARDRVPAAEAEALRGWWQRIRTAAHEPVILELR